MNIKTYDPFLYSLKCTVCTWFMLMCILLSLSACDPSSNDNSENVNTSPPLTTSQLSLSIMPNYLINDEELFVYDLTNEGDLVLQTRVQPDEKGLATVVLELEKTHIYKIVFNPANSITAIRCPLRKGCIAKSFVNHENEHIAFSQPLNTRLQLEAIIHLTEDKALTLNVNADLVAQLLQSNYVDEINAATLKQTQSVLANTVGLIGYEKTQGSPIKNDWNQWSNQALNAAILFENRRLYSNVSEHLESVFRRLYYTFKGDENLIDEFNHFYLADADLFLQDVILTNTSNNNTDSETNNDRCIELTAPDCSSISHSQKQLIARLRAYLLSKNIYPEKGYMPSPYLHETELAKSKAFLDDFRSILYTFKNDAVAYAQLNNSVKDGYKLIDGFSNDILVELLPLFSDILKNIPLGSDNGSYHHNELTITYQNSKLQWKLVGQYQNLSVDLTLTIQKLKVDPTEGNLFMFLAQGEINSDDSQTRLTDTQFTLKFNPADNVFSGIKDGSGSISIKAKRIVVQQENTQFTGEMNTRLELHLVEQKGIVTTLESASVFGKLTSETSEHKLCVALVHPNVYQESSDQLIANDIITAVSYSANLQGLGEPLLSLYINSENIKSGLNINNIDMNAYFEGRFSQFTFKGESDQFTYQGKNQDSVQWSLIYHQKETQGQVTLQGKLQGRPRILKDLAGIMFNDGNFISVF